jgi:hypothetical protein
VKHRGAERAHSDANSPSCGPLCAADSSFDQLFFIDGFRGGEAQNTADIPTTEALDARQLASQR